MSRIHEALKKAEMERVAQAGEAPSTPDAYQAAVVQEMNSAAATATDVLPPPQPRVAVSAMAPAGPLQFENLRAHCARPEWHLHPNMNVFFDPAVSGDAAEQFRTLRSRLYQMRTNLPLRIVLVTSPVPGDGKTFVTTNLAHAIVRQPDRRVLIIDGDLRASRLHIPLGAPKGPGLSDYLQGDADEMAVIQHGQESDLFFIAGGNVAANPSELLANGRLKILLDRVGPLFDWVIFDSPPCLPVADARVIADFCDGILLVVKAAATPVPSAQKAAQELEGKNIIGVVLNRVEEGALAYSSYYGSAYDGRGRGRLDTV